MPMSKRKKTVHTVIRIQYPSKNIKNQYDESTNLFHEEATLIVQPAQLKIPRKRIPTSRIAREKKENNLPPSLQVKKY